MKLRTLSLLLLLALAAAALSACTLKISTDGDNTQPKPSLSVTGDGWADVKPDLATASIGVQTRDKDAGKAVEANNELAGKIIAAIKEQGFADADVLTSNFSVSSQQDYNPETGQQTGEVTYVVDNTVTVTIRDLTKVGAVLDAATGAGANNIQGVNFSVEDQTAALTEARNKALADAKARAEQLARGTGATLGAVMNLNEYQNSGPVPLADSFGRGGGGGVMEAAAAPAPVSAGTFRVQVQVSITYEIK